MAGILDDGPADKLAKERATNGHPSYKIAFLGIGNESWIAAAT